MKKRLVDRRTVEVLTEMDIISCPYCHMLYSIFSHEWTHNPPIKQGYGKVTMFCPYCGKPQLGPDTNICGVKTECIINKGD